MKYIFVLMALPLAAQTVVGPRVPATGTYANRPTSPATNTVYIVTDDNGSCAGGGSTRVQCQWNGSSWVAISGSGGGGGTPGGSSGQVQYNNTGAFGGFTPAGDLTLSIPNFTLATVNSGSGVCGDSTHVCQVTTNAKGLVTTQSAVAIAGGGGGGVSCPTATITASAIATAAGASTTVEMPMSALAGVAGTSRWGESTLSETVQFVGTGVTGLTVGMGRAGNSPEMSGAPLTLLVSSGDVNFWPFVPPPPQLTGTYSPILKFTSTGGNLNALTAGTLTWQVCKIY